MELEQRLNAQHMETCKRVVALAMAMEDWELVQWGIELYRRYMVRYVEGGKRNEE